MLQLSVGAVREARRSTGSLEVTRNGSGAPSRKAICFIADMAAGACVNGARALHKSAAGEAARPAPWRCFATSLSRASAPPRPADLAWDSVRGLSSMHAPCCRAMSTSAGRGGPGRDASSRNRAVALYALAGATFMLGLSYVAVPLYRMFCAATGYGGTVQRGGHGSGGAEAGEPRTLEAKLLAKKEGQEALDEAARNRRGWAQAGSQ